MLAFGLLVLSLLSGCGGKGATWPAASGAGRCQQLWLATETRIENEEVADAATVRVRNFPYLRSNRYLQALGAQAVGSSAQLYVLEQMRLLDLDKRQLELSRLSKESLAALTGSPAGSADAMGPELASCSRHFLHEDLQRPAFFEEVRQGIDLDRDYSLWLRSVGLYPLVALVVDAVAENAQEKMVGRLSAAVAPQAGEDSLTFRPGPLAAAWGPDLPTLLRRGREGPLLSLNLAAPDLLGLARRFAPLLTIADGADQNRFGRIVRTENGFGVHGREPVVYYYFSQTFVQALPALQINYVIWFPRRSTPAPWFERGSLDGLNFRVTLDWQGQVVFVDVAHQCGCYHFVLFNEGLVRAKGPAAPGFQPTVAGPLPRLATGERLCFAMSSGWHQIARVSAAPPALSQPTYQLRPYGELESFQAGNGVVSLFNSKGRVAGSNRLERFFLFPMGIPKVGAMRQRGRQPITLIGRAYFDSPSLFDEAFAYHHPLPGLAELTWPEGGDGGTAAIDVPRGE